MAPSPDTAPAPAPTKEPLPSPPAEPAKQPRPVPVTHPRTKPGEDFEPAPGICPLRQSASDSYADGICLAELSFPSF
jgi:hypothetical protein